MIERPRSRCAAAVRCPRSSPRAALSWSEACCRNAATSPSHRSPRVPGRGSDPRQATNRRRCRGASGRHGGTAPRTLPGALRPVGGANRGSAVGSGRGRVRRALPLIRTLPELARGELGRGRLATRPWMAVAAARRLRRSAELWNLRGAAGAVGEDRGGRLVPREGGDHRQGQHLGDLSGAVGPALPDERSPNVAGAPCSRSRSRRVCAHERAPDSETRSVRVISSVRSAPWISGSGEPVQARAGRRRR